MNSILSPKFFKYRKVHNRKCCLGNKFKSIDLHYGTYGLVSKCFGYLSSCQIEAIKNIVLKNTKKVGKVWVSITPSLPILKKSKSSRMGSGIGGINGWVYRVCPGSVIIEMSGVKYRVILDIFNGIACRLPFKLCFVEKIFCKYEEN